MSPQAKSHRSAAPTTIVWIERLSLAEVLFGLGAVAAAASVTSGWRDLVEGVPPSLLLVGVTLYFGTRVRAAPNRVWPIVTLQVLWVGFVGLYGWFPTGSLGTATLVPILVCVPGILLLAVTTYVKRASRHRTPGPTV